MMTSACGTIAFSLFILACFCGAEWAHRKWFAK